MKPEKSSPTPLPLAKSIWVQGYKSLREKTQLPLARLNVLAGANSSGKSSLMQPLLLLKQTWEARFDAQPLLLDGAHVHLNRFEQLLSRGANAQAAAQFMLGVQFPKGAVLELVFARTAGASGIAQTIAQTIATGSSEHLKTLRSIVSHMIHVPGLRGQASRRYPVATVGERFTGTFDPYVAAVIAQWQETQDKRLGTLNAQLAQLGLTNQVVAQKGDDVSFELNVGRLPVNMSAHTTDLVSIADVGFGVSQVLPVLVALLVGRAGQLVYIEQPEIHLHPKAQRALAHVFADAVVSGQAQVVVETHSTLFLREIQTLVAKAQLDKSLVKLHWVTRNEQGNTEIATCDLDDAGAYGDWPQDFDETESQAATDYYTAAEAVLFKS